MKHLSLFLAIVISLNLSAQFPGGGAPGGNKAGGAAPAIGHIYGKVVDSTGKPVIQASVVLLQRKRKYYLKAAPLMVMVSLILISFRFLLLYI